MLARDAHRQQADVAEVGEVLEREAGLAVVDDGSLADHRAERRGPGRRRGRGRRVYLRVGARASQVILTQCPTSMSTVLSTLLTDGRAVSTMHGDDGDVGDRRRDRGRLRLARGRARPTTRRRSCCCTGSAAAASRGSRSSPDCRARHRVVAWDLPGYGESRAASTGALTFTALADAVAAFVDECCASRPVHLVGISFGGMIAQYAAARHPAIVAPLTLLSTSPALRSRRDQARRTGGRPGWRRSTRGSSRPTSPTAVLAGLAGPHITRRGDGGTGGGDGAASPALRCGVRSTAWSPTTADRCCRRSPRPPCAWSANSTTRRRRRTRWPSPIWSPERG